MKAQETGIVPTMIRAASQAKIEVNPLRRNISVLEGSGGNIGGDSRGLPRPVFQAEQRAETPAGSQVESPPTILARCTSNQGKEPP
jgi:hypothetical protein